MLYVINIGFERANAKFFRMLEKNAPRKDKDVGHPSSAALTL